MLLQFLICRRDAMPGGNCLYNARHSCNAFFREKYIFANQNVEVRQVCQTIRHENSLRNVQNAPSTKVGKGAKISLFCSYLGHTVKAISCT